MFDPCCRPVTFRQAVRGVVNSPEELRTAEYLPTSVATNRILARMRQGESGNKYSRGYYSLKRLWWDRPSRTICATSRLSRGSCECCHPGENRKLTMPELKRVSSFPDAWRFPSAEGRRQMGNCMPPLFMRAIALRVAALLEAAA